MRQLHGLGKRGAYAKTSAHEVDGHLALLCFGAEKTRSSQRPASTQSDSGLDKRTAIHVRHEFLLRTFLGLMGSSHDKDREP